MTRPAPQKSESVELRPTKTRQNCFQVPVVLTGLLILFGLAGTPAIGAPQVAGSVIQLGSDKAIAGGSAFLPVIFSPAPGIGIGSLLATITFPNKLLSFEEIKKDPSLDSIGADVNTAVKSDDKSPDNSVLEVRVNGKAGKAIGGGVIVTVVLKISQNVPVGKKIEVQYKAIAQTLHDPPKSLELASGNAEVETIEIPGLFACFFYMH